MRWIQYIRINYNLWINSKQDQNQINSHELNSIYKKSSPTYHNKAASALIRQKSTSHIIQPAS